MKMIDIWKEKPFSRDHYQGVRQEGYCYSEEEMDAWLEKLKAEHDSLKRIVDGLVDLGVVEVYDDRYWSTDYNQLKEKAEKGDKAYSGVDDDEMPFTPERISLVMNYVNDHHPDFDTSKEFEDMIIEYIKWEGELGEAEEKLEAIENWFKENEDNIDPDYTQSGSRDTLRKILEDSEFTTKGEESE